MFRVSKLGATLGTFITNPVTIFFIYPAQTFLVNKLLFNGSLTYEKLAETEWTWVAVRRLGAEIDSAGNIVKGGGTIDGFTVAEKGVFNISGGQFGGELLVPYTFMNITDAANFRSWTVAVGGVLTPKYKIVVSAEGVRVYPVGTIVIMR